MKIEDDVTPGAPALAWAGDPTLDCAVELADAEAERPPLGLCHPPEGGCGQCEDCAPPARKVRRVA